MIDYEAAEEELLGHEGRVSDEAMGFGGSTLNTKAATRLIIEAALGSDLVGIDAGSILEQFQGERERAHQKHGEHSQEGNAWDSRRSTEILFEEIGEIAKVFNERALGNLTDLEAMTELRKELVQAGAMCLVWISNIDAAQ